MLENVVHRSGLPSRLWFGYVGVLIFMMGEGLEQGWLSPYVISRGLSIRESALLFSVYGFAAALAAGFPAYWLRCLGRVV